MPEDASVTKEKIVSLLRARGPSLPVHVAKHTGLSILFASAFLSELIADRKIKQSSMRVGSSPLYFLPGQEPMLERFSEYLKSKEKEAFLLLREKKFLKDSEQQPAIRVALRAINDFAISFTNNHEVYWRYFAVSEADFKPIQEIKKAEKPIEVLITKVAKIPETEIDKKEKPPKTKKKTSKPKTNEKFLERVKEFLSKSSTEILSIEGLKKDELMLRIKKDKEEQLLAAYNKKKITDKEIIKAAKKASELNLKYSVLSLGELPKKVSDLIEALENMKDIGKVE
ncbi:hypothetical protein HYT24_00830 [Candidatus Pacearchaeota archaeon]|nr:hypothetical protein [Candidatus Pacearchaeota archaeon]